METEKVAEATSPVLSIPNKYTDNNPDTQDFSPINFTSIKEEIKEIHTVEDDVKASIIDLSFEYPDCVPIVKQGDAPVCTIGNFSMVTGTQGSRKTFAATGIMGAYLSGDFFGLTGEKADGDVLWIDTEQASAHVAKIGKRLNRIIDEPENQNNSKVKILSLREFGWEQRRIITEKAIEMYHPVFCVIDGIADLIADVNDPRESKDIIDWLLQITKRNEMHILIVLHLNPGSDKVRGHLGSEAWRKCETALNVSTKNDISTVKATKNRDIPTTEFAFTVERGLPTVVDIPTIPTIVVKLRSLFETILPLPNSMKYTQLCNKIMERDGVKIDAAKQDIRKGKDNKIIEKNDAGYYSLCQKSMNDEDEDENEEESVLPF